MVARVAATIVAAMRQEIWRFAFQAMASQCEVVLAAPNAQQAQTWADLAIKEVRRIEAKYSRYTVDSIISRINASAGQQAVEIDSETAHLLSYTDALFTSSGGLFDISSGILRRAWDFRSGRAPSHSELAPLLPLINWAKVEHSDQHIFLPQTGMEIDFGGFGKEYAADRAASAIQAQGGQHGYVNLGGDLRIFGPRPDGQAWQIGIQDPRKLDATCASLAISQGGLATSGDYERFFEQDGQRHCHILLPHSGQSVRYWRSVSVLAPLCVAAGSLATIAMLKQAQGLAFLQQAGVAFLAIAADGQMHQQTS